MRTLSFLRHGHIMIFHIGVFSLFRWVLLAFTYRSLPPPLSVSAPQNTPFLGFFGVFPSHACICVWIYIYKYMYHPVASSLHSRLIFSLMLSLSWITRAGLSALFPHRRFPERLTSVAGVAPSLGYLLLFLTVCPHKQNGGLLFLLLWYGGRVGGTATLGVKGREAEDGRRGELVFVGVRDWSEPRFVSVRFYSLTATAFFYL